MPAANDDQDPRAQKPNWVDIWTFMISSLTLVAVVVYACITYGMLKEMRAATDLARTHFIRDQRPYLWISGMGAPEIAIGKRILWKINYANFGKSPAIGFLIRGQISFGKDLETKTAPDFFARIHPPGDITSGSIVQPGDKTAYTTGFSEKIVSSADYGFIMGNDSAVILLVHFEYFDTAGNEYHSEICRLRLQTGAVNSCKAHNRIY